MTVTLREGLPSTIPKEIIGEGMELDLISMDTEKNACDVSDDILVLKMSVVENPTD